MSVHRMSDIGGLIQVEIGHHPQNDTRSTVNGTGIDRQDLASVTLFAFSGAATGTPATQLFDAKLQHSTLIGSAYVDVTDGAVTQIAADDGSAYVDVDCTGLNQFVRVVATVAFTGGSSPEWPVATTLIFGGARTEPVA